MNWCTAYGYVRASADGQKLTSEEQRAKILEHYERACHDLVWGDCFEDPRTSSKLRLANRRAGSALLVRLKPGDHLIIAGFDNTFLSFPEGVRCDIGFDTTPYTRESINEKP